MKPGQKDAITGLDSGDTKLCPTWDKVLSTDWPSLEKQSRANFAIFTPA